MVEILGVAAAVLAVANLWVRRSASQRIMAPLDFEVPESLGLPDTLTGRRASAPVGSEHVGRLHPGIQGKTAVHREIHAGHIA